tara:strand:+ start:11836 stop:13917 length:2082 start_codon:yes stop_codon:yes gene_type:complete
MKTFHNDEPVVYTISNFIDDKTCDHFISIARNKLKQALVSSNDKGYVSRGRTGKNCWLPHSYDSTTKKIAELIANEVGLPVKNAESYQVIYYGPTEEYRNHTDSWDHDLSEKARRCLRFGGQRMITALCYLNTVEEGGHTRFTKLDINSSAEKGKLLVFHNVFKGTNKKHPMSEHAGTPVLKGEKWAFNLWFREDDFKKIVYNPPAPDPTPSTTSATLPPQLKMSSFQKSEETGSLALYDNILTVSDVARFNSVLTFDKSTDRKTCQWLKNADYPEISNKFATLFGTDIAHLENMCFVQYPANYIHNCHHDAFATNIPNSKVFSERQGQRLKTITGFLNDGVMYSFRKLNRDLTPTAGAVITYDNVFPGTIVRDDRVEKRITNTTNQPVVIFHVFWRERTRDTNFRPPPPGLTIPPITINSDGKAQLVQPVNNQVNNQTISNTDKEDYGMTLKVAYAGFQKGNISKGGYKSLTFSNIRTPWEDVTQTALDMLKMRDDNFGLLQKERLTDTYNFDEFTPVIINNAVIPDAAKRIAHYYKNAIDNNLIPFGDRQSKRFKTRNDPIARLLQYEILPLVERFTKQKLMPTYTYLSCYIKDADLPAHTDNPECLTTVSYMLDKPEGTSWPIYFDPTKQPTKHKGRYSEPYFPPNEKCIACDCQPGGFMAFDGTDHLHYRLPLEHDYYYLLLLHYKPRD